MDKIPLIKPTLINAVANKSQHSSGILHAEVISSKPVINDSQQSQQNTQQNSQQNTRQYNVELKIGQQTIATLSTHDLKPGSQIDVKVLPGPELRIVSSEKNIERNAATTHSQRIEALAQQVLADRVPKINQQDAAALVKQLSQQLSQQPPQSSAQLSNPQANQATNTNTSANPLSNAALIGNKLYQNLQNLSLNNPLSNPLNNAGSTDTDNGIINNSLSTSLKINSNELLQQSVHTWLKNLPQSQQISTAVGLKNALNNTGIHAESQLLKLSQQQLNLPQSLTNNANSIFQQLQKASALVFDRSVQNNVSPPNHGPAQNNRAAAENVQLSLSQRVKNTAKILSDSSQQIFANLNRNSQTNPLLVMKEATAQPPPAVGINWQSPLMNSPQFTSLEGLLQDPLLQNPSSNNKLALAQIIGLNSTQQSLAGIHKSLPNIPLNWPERSGNDAMLLRTLQNLLGQIEREQIQQMQSNDGNQANAAGQQTTSQTLLQQQWLPLLVLHQQQLQLIEFIIDQEEVENSQGEKKQHWFINLHFELPMLGKMGIEIAMFDNECSTTFWSESRTALSQISQHIQPLRERLTEQGILVNDIQSRYGTLTKRKVNIEQRLVDITT